MSDPLLPADFWLRLNEGDAAFLHGLSVFHEGVADRIESQGFRPADAKGHRDVAARLRYAAAEQVIRETIPPASPPPKRSWLTQQLHKLFRRSDA